MSIKYKKLSFELYDVLGMSVRGEALTIGRVVLDTNGTEAWRRFNRRYSPRTPASTLAKLKDVLNLGIAKTAHDLANILENWELKLNVFGKVYLDEISAKTKMISMCTQEMQDII